MDFHILPGGFRCIPGGLSYLPGMKFTTSSHPQKFWKFGIFPGDSSSPYRGTKTWCHKESIILKEHRKTITYNKKIAEIFNNFFSNIVKNLNINSDLSDITCQTSKADPAELSRGICS